ncbi:hypothetical protein cyc_00371 [Cyclospora cayetanensis]|uniref:CCDC43 PWI-like domain-containing protein n=1 Tax=Cyclospora cayetanensis TaxID=88456 RepID=A0A1D3CXT0_9EIME|nr:hypothetical protein cyc_00371 [Cyclospora cayetanensis]
MESSEELSAFKSFLSEGLEALGLDTEVFVEYVLGVLEAASKGDAGGEEQQHELKVEIQETLSLSLDDPSPQRQEQLDAFCCGCAERWVHQVLPATAKQHQKQRQQALDAVFSSSTAGAPQAVEEAPEDETARRIREVVHTRVCRR